MRVCLFNDSFPPVLDGVANVVMNYAQIMQEQGMADVMVATPRYPDANYEKYLYRVEPYDSLDTTKIAMGYRAGNPLSIKELKTLTEFEPEILHAHSPVSATYMARLLRLQTNVPLVYTYHTKYDIDVANALKGKLVQKEAIRAIVRNISACDEVWVVSKGAGENLCSLGYEGEYRVMENGVDFVKGRACEEQVAEATAGYDLPQNVPVFLFVGRLMNYKGLPLILEALHRLSEDGVDFRMVFVGGGPDGKELQEKAEKLLPPEKYIFTGPIQDREMLRAWNTRADLFLFPSTFDTNGLVVREAAACGLASVLIQGSCAAEGVTDGVDGFLIEQTPEAMYALLKLLCNDREYLHRVGAGAMEHLYISWEESVHKAYDRYLQILDDYRSGRLVLKHHALTESILQLEADVKEQKERSEQFLKELQRDWQEVQQSMKNIQKEIEKELFDEKH